MNHPNSVSSHQPLLLLIIVGMYWFSQYVSMPYQTPYLLSIGTAASWAGVVVGAYGFTQLLLRLPVGLMADRKGNHKPFILIGVLAAGGASFLRVFFPHAIGFLCANLLAGTASAMWISFMVLYSSYFSEKEIQKATAKIIAVNNLGILFGFLAGTLFYDQMGMQFLCILSGVASIPAIFLALRIREPVLNIPRLAVKELVHVYCDKKLLLFSAFALIQQGILMSTCMSFTTEIAQQRGASGWEIGLCSIVYIAAAVLTSYFSSSRMAIRFGGRLWIPLIFGCLGLYCLLVPILPNVAWFYPVQLLAGASTGILFPFCTSETMKNIPLEKKSTAMGFFQAVYAIGMTFFPIATGSLAQMFPIQAAFSILAGFAFLGAIVALIFYRKEYHNHHENS